MGSCHGHDEGLKDIHNPPLENNRESFITLLKNEIFQIFNSIYINPFEKPMGLYSYIAQPYFNNDSYWGVID